MPQNITKVGRKNKIRYIRSKLPLAVDVPDRLDSKDRAAGFQKGRRVLAAHPETKLHSGSLLHLGNALVSSLLFGS